MDKVTNSLNIAVPQGSFTDEGDGVVSFPNGLTITDNSVQRNGTTYDIDSLDTSRYGNQLTGDHEDRLSSLIGEVQGTSKLNGRVVVNKIRYAIKENPYARLAYDLLVGGFSKNFSTETIGPPPDENGVYRNAELVGLSQVVTQNNYNAHVNQFVHNSLERAKQDGLDITGVEDKLLHHNAVDAPEKDKMDENNKQNNEGESQNENKNVEDQNQNPNPAQVEKVPEEQSTRVEAPAVTDAKENPEQTPQTPQTVNGEGQTQAEVKNVEQPQPTQQPAPQPPAQDGSQQAGTPNQNTNSEEQNNSAEKETNNKEDKMDKDENKVAPSLTAEQVAEIVANAVKPLTDKVSSLESEAKNAFDASAKEPEFKKDENKVEEKATNKYAAMDNDTRYNKQVEAAWNAVKLNSVEAWQTLREINAINLDRLKEAGIAKNSMSLDDLGNFVIPPEMYNEIVGVRNDYTPILNATEWKETLSLEFAWLQRTGDIDMRSVALNATDNDADANLKPISEYAATPKTSSLEELAAVTVVATSATRFAAVDLLSDAATGYRWDYDRKRAQLVVARLQQAVDANGFVTGYDTTALTDGEALTAWLEAITSISDTTLNGTLVFNARTFAELKSRALRAGTNGPLSELLTTGTMPTVFGYNFIIVPNQLMPSLGVANDVRTFEIEGENVDVTCAIFFADLTTFTGRTSGGLQYDVSNSASYESGGVVKSAYQRNELVLRGSFFRGGAIKNPKVVAGVTNGAVS